MTLCKETSDDQDGGPDGLGGGSREVDGKLHLLEEMKVVAADREDFGPFLEL